MAISGKIVKPSDVVNFTYSGDIQQWIVPMSGLYMLEVWGAIGGGSPNTGGYSKGYIYLDKDTVLYIVCGGAGTAASPQGIGGYNGGGNSDVGDSTANGGGGGATHIATKSGLLSTLKSFISNILLVAGGGGGRGGYGSMPSGGSGGGYSGASGLGYNSNYTVGSGGTQNSGYAFGQGGVGGRIGGTVGTSGGGGGGFYGGYGAVAGGAGTTGSAGGGGGSGYIGGVPAIVYNGVTYNPTTMSGQNNGSGKAAITLIASSSGSCYLKDQQACIYKDSLAASWYLKL